MKKKTYFTILKIPLHKILLAFKTELHRKGLSNTFALNLSSVLSHVLLVHLFNKNDKDTGYQWQLKKLI